MACMNILILTYGSRGDVQPYVALGKGLKAAGHNVTLATSERFRGFVEEHGLAFGYMNDDLLSVVDTDQGKELMEKSSNLFEMFRLGIKLAKRLKPLQRLLHDESWEVAKAAKPDVIVYHPKTPVAIHIAEKLGVKVIFTTPIPMYVPTSDYPFIFFRKIRFWPRLNRLGYYFIRFVTRATLSGYMKDFRAKIGLPKLRRINFFKTAEGKDIPILHCHSEAVLPRPADWPDYAHVTGYWFLDAKQEWTPPQDLQDFLDAGAPPVYIGFGSMSGRDPERLAGIVIRALQKAGLRGVIATGWGGLKAENLPDSIFKIEHAPHDWLFPRMAAVVHHGGAGTTAAGLRAGKPTIIIPFFADQPFWGGHVAEIGAGPQPIFQKKLTDENLAHALSEATGNQDIIKTVAHIGEKIRAEDGVARAVALIEQYASKQ